MKVAIPTTDKLTIYGHTGHADYFLVLNVEDGKVTDREFRDNPHINHEQHGNHPDHEPGQHDHNHDHANHNHNNHMHGDDNAHDKMIESIEDCQYFIVKHVGRRCAPSLKKFDVKPVLVKGHGDILIEDIIDQIANIPTE